MNWINLAMLLTVFISSAIYYLTLIWLESVIHYTIPIIIIIAQFAYIAYEVNKS